METVIHWRDPNREPPPFDQVILAVICYQSTPDCGLSWQGNLDPYPLIVSTDSPNDSSSQTEIESFVRGQSSFKEHLFFITDRHGDKFSSFDLNSDSIVLWAEMPEFFSLIKN